MKPPTRIALNITMPPLLATCGFITIMVGVIMSEWVGGNSPQNTGGLFRDVAKTGLMIAFYAYIIATIPSILHAALMEFVYLKFPAHKWAAVAASTLSGLLAGALMTGFLANGDVRKITDQPVLIVLGSIVGFVLGLIVKRLSRKKACLTASTLRSCE